MTNGQIESIISACENNEIKEYQFVTDNNNNLYNSESSILRFKDGILWSLGLAPKMGGIAANNAILISGSDSESIHEFRVRGNYDSLKGFIEELGLEISDDDERMLRQIDANNLVVHSVPPDYKNIFHELSPAEYEALTPEEKAKYDEAKKKDEERFKLPKGIAGRIDNNYNFPYAH